jgi:putative phage-type endonuclease
MSLTAEQIATRSEGVTASEMAAIVGLSPYATALDVYLEKLGLVEPKEDSEAMYWGRVLEPHLLDRYANDFGVELEFPGTTKHGRHPRIIGTPDAIVRGERRGVEAKAHGFFQRREFGEVHTDSVPDRHIIQCAVYMAVFDCERWDLVTLLGGQDFRVYHLYRDRDLEENLISIGEAFWRDHVEALAPPDPTDADRRARALLARFPAHDNSLVDAEAEAIRWAEELRDVRSHLAALTDVKDELEGNLKERIGAHGGISGPDFTITWKRTKDTVETDWKAVALELEASLELIARHSRRKPGTRRFVPKWKERQAP